MKLIALIAAMTAGPAVAQSVSFEQNPAVIAFDGFSVLLSVVAPPRGDLPEKATKRADDLCKASGKAAELQFTRNAGAGRTEAYFICF